MTYHVRVNGQTIGPLDVAALVRRSSRWRAQRLTVEVAPTGSQAFVPLDQFLAQLPAAPAPNAPVALVAPPASDAAGVQYHVRIGSQRLGPLGRAEIEQRAPQWLKLKGATVEVAPAGTSSFVSLDAFLRNQGGSAPRPAPGGTQTYDVRVNGQLLGPFILDEIVARAARWMKLAPAVEVKQTDHPPIAFVPLHSFLEEILKGRRQRFSVRSFLSLVVSQRTLGLSAAAAVVVVVLAVVGVLTVMLASGTRLTVAPNVTVQRLQWNSAIPDRPAEEFDVSPTGSIVIRIDDALYDLMSGERLAGLTAAVRSFAFVRGALMVLTSQGRVAFWADEQLHDMGEAPLGVSRVLASETGDQAFFVSTGLPYGLFSFSPDGSLQVLTGSPAIIDAVAGGNRRPVFAVGSSLFSLAGPGRPVPLLDLHDESSKIVGLATDGETIYFASPQVVYVLRGGLAIPLVIGLGGSLRRTADALLVLDSFRGRVYRLSFGLR